MADWELPGQTIRRPAVMGVVNVTPDSFSDGGLSLDPDRAVEQAAALAAQGADILDIGGESSRPGASPVSSDVELGRVLPLLDALRGRLSLPISVDTTKATVAARALEAGASIVNDISAGEADPNMLRVVAERGSGLVLMHMRGNPRNMQDEPRYDDVVSEVHDYLARRLDAALRAGIQANRIAIDPGIGFGKTVEHNLEILRHLDRFRRLGHPVLIGTSRKRFLGVLTGREVHERVAASTASALAALVSGADIARVHDVAPLVDAIRVWGAQAGWDR